MERNPTIPAATKPTIKSGKKLDKSGRFTRSFILITPAPNITGMDIRNENFAASSRFNFRKIPPAIVEPDLDTPGKIAKTWKQPMINASSVEISSFF